MYRKILIVSAMLATLLLAGGSILADEGNGDAEITGGDASMWVFISSAFGMALVSSFAAIAMSISVKSFCEGVARNPSAGDRLQLGLILTLVLIETLALYVLAVIFVKVNI